MSFATSYAMREQARATLRWLGEHARIVSLAAALAITLLVYTAFFLRPFESREMVILYRPDAARGSVVFNLGAEYRLRTLRLVALDDQGREGDTLWKFDVPGDAPRLSTFSLPPRARRGQAADNPPPPLDPEKTYRLKVLAAGARGSADFTLAAGDAEVTARRQGG